MEVTLPADLKQQVSKSSLMAIIRARMNSSSRPSGTISTNVSVANGGSMRCGELVRRLTKPVSMSEFLFPTKNDQHTARAPGRMRPRELLFV